MDKLPALKPLKLEGNLAENWRRWKQRYELFMTATEANKIVAFSHVHTALLYDCTIVHLLP